MAVLHTTLRGGGTPDQVWSVLREIATYPEFMDGVNEVTVTGEDGDKRTSSWIVELKGSEMEWDQEDVLDPAARRFAFRQTDGDLAHYEGYWQVHEDAEGTALELNVEFDVGLPMVEEMIHPAVARALESYQQGIVDRSREA
ncbi:type II toxin-antitoxin system RatA family toxin [Streptomyces sp. NPDC058739]|uniref:type II toxin-antitoxin system RatA family toxin n=1 Tax=unclassified Streptomyces TaxID=2593676 RepID=UPI0036C739B4